MSAGNTDQIPELFDFFNKAFQSGEVDRKMLTRFWNPDARLITRFAALEGRSYEGLDGLIAFITESRRQFERFEVRLERVAGDGDRRVAVYRVDALTSDTQVPIEQRLGMQLEFREGRIQLAKVFADPREALEAFGFDPGA
jgi:ketosteroid isomerase-like protein